MKGFTKEEVFLNSISEKSFLKFWSWPNLFRDQRINNKTGDGKEICDLTVIFGNHILLFSDKKIKFNEEKELRLAWSRWSRKAIGESIKQIKGARRWLLDYPERVYVDSKCSQKIPLEIPLAEDIIFHNIVVCHGIETMLSSRNRESSFLFDNSIKGDQHWDLEKCTPFCIGQIFEDDFVHIFNESTIQLVLQEFNTASDFIDYLSQREALLKLDKPVKIISESDIIQLYYESFIEELGERSILENEIINSENIFINKDGIKKLYSNPSYIFKQQEDEISYFWDQLIEEFSYHVLEGSSEFKNWSSPNEVEPHIRIMAQTSRFERRVLSDAFFNFYNRVEPKMRGTRLYSDLSKLDQAYLFLALPYDSFNQNYDEYKKIRRDMLQDYCIINKLLKPSINSIIGMAFKTRDKNQILTPDFFKEGQDFLFIDLSEWNNKDIKEAEKVYKEYIENKLIKEQKMTERKIEEFNKS